MIQNFKKLASSPLRQQALEIAESAYAAIATAGIISSQVSYDDRHTCLQIQNQVFDLAQFEKIVCVGFGKAALEAVTAVQEILKDRITCGFVIDLKGGLLGNITCRVGTHPHPTEVNVQATKELVEMLSHLTEKDLVIVVVSGGGSSLLCYPQDLSCQSQTALEKELFAQGAGISEINTVRKHISRVKGGNLAKICYPATVAALIFSDVPGDDLGLVASGPTVKDATTTANAAAVLKKYDILEACQLPSCRLYETPKEDKYFVKVHNFLLVSAHTAIAAMKIKAEELGWQVKVYSENFQGQAKILGPEIAGRPMSGQCLLGTGESTVKIVGHGSGGRNQELALAALPALQNDEVLLSLASDGWDNTEVAGAIVDVAVRRLAAEMHLDPQVYLNDNDSYHFFQQVGSAVFTGLTGANVSDFFVCLKK